MEQASSYAQLEHSLRSIQGLGLRPPHIHQLSVFGNLAALASSPAEDLLQHTTLTHRQAQLLESFWGSSCS